MVKKSLPPLDNIVYYPRGTRVLWNGKPGVVHRVVIKPKIKYQVGYDIILDSQSNEKDPIPKHNAGYDDLVLESTGEKSTDGEYVKPLEKVED